MAEKKGWDSCWPFEQSGQSSGLEARKPFYPADNHLGATWPGSLSRTWSSPLPIAAHRHCSPIQTSLLHSRGEPQGFGIAWEGERVRLGAWIPMEDSKRVRFILNLSYTRLVRIKLERTIIDKYPSYTLTTQSRLTLMPPKISLVYPEFRLDFNPFVAKGDRGHPLLNARWVLRVTIVLGRSVHRGLIEVA